MKSIIIYEFKSPSSIFYPCNINQYSSWIKYSSLHYRPKIFICITSWSCSSQHLFIFALRAKDIHQLIIHLCTTGQRCLVISSFRTEDDEKYFKENESSEMEGQIVGIHITVYPRSIILHNNWFWSRTQK